MGCKYDGRERPRVISGRHEGDCWTLNNGEGACEGCLPCTEPHCRVCGIAHHDGACPECLASTRDDLRNIGVLCDALPAEVQHRGIDGEAMVLLGPAADPEARGHLEASILAGRVPADYLDHADDERHPLSVLGTWVMVWQDALEHEDDSQVTVVSAIDYLDRQLTYMAGYEHVPFEDFASGVRQCRSHLEAVLHDGEQVDTGAPCLQCGARLEKVWASAATLDAWACPRCKRTSTPGQYALAVREDYESRRHELAYLPMADMVEVTGVGRGTISGWASKNLVKRRREFGRTVYCVEDVRRHAGCDELHNVDGSRSIRSGQVSVRSGDVS